MKRVGQVPKLRFFKFGPDTTMVCCGCTNRIREGDVMIQGNLIGSGSHGFLILCESCKKIVIEELQK